MFRLVLYYNVTPILILDTHLGSIREKVAKSIRPFLNVGESDREPLTLELSNIESKNISPK